MTSNFPFIINLFEIIIIIILICKTGKTRNLSSHCKLNLASALLGLINKNNIGTIIMGTNYRRK